MKKKRLKQLYDIVRKIRAKENDAIGTESQVDTLCAEFFRAASGVSVEAFKAMATQGLDTLTQTLEYKGNQSVFSFRYAGERFSNYYTLDFDNRVLGVENIENKVPDRNTGRHVIGMSVMPAVFLDFDTVEMTAGRTMGGYSWAKAGALPKDDARLSLPYRIRRRLMALQDVLPEQDYAQAFALSALKEDGDLQKIAQSGQTLEGVGDRWNRVCALEYNSVVDHEYYVEEGYFPGGRMTLGHFLLCGQSYPAQINLKDAAQIERVAAYTGVDIRGTARTWRAAHPGI